MADSFDIKDFTLGTAKTVKTKTIGGKEYPAHILYDETGAQLGTTTDAADVRTDATALSWTAIFKQISKSVQLMVFGAGTAAAAQRTTLASDDPAVAVLGVTTGAKVITDVSGTIQQYLRGLVTLVAGTLAVSSKWAAGSGVGYTWTSIMTTELNSIASGNAILGLADITNQTAQDRYCDFSVHLASAIFPNTQGLNISIHLYPLCDDGSTYGDGKFGSSAAGPPNYPPAAVIPLVINVTQAQTGVATGVVIPPGTWRPVLCNNGGVALASSGNTLKYRTYN